MTTAPLRIGYLVGRFNPLQKGHLALLEQVDAENDRMVVLVGSATEARTHKNPLTYHERKQLLLASFPNALVLPLPDLGNDDEWVRLFESTLMTGIDSLQLTVPFEARMYSADATRADDYALRCNWVKRLGHSVVPFPPVKAPMDLSASLVRDRWYSGSYDEVRELVPEATFALLQQLDIGWMRTSYVKKIPTGELGPKNRAYLAIVDASNGAARLVHLLHENGEFGWLSTDMAGSTSGEQALVAHVYEEFSQRIPADALVPVSSHAVAFQGDLEHAHLYLYRTEQSRLCAWRDTHAPTVEATVLATRLQPSTLDVLREQRWTGPGRDLLQVLRQGGHLDALEHTNTTTGGVKA